MGESSWKKRYSIYGYNLDTTPKMKKIFTGNLNSCVLSGYSGATITRDSIPLSFSFSKPENNTGLTKEKSIIELAKIQGYKTYWLSSQNISGLFASKYGYLTKSADVVEFTHKNDNKIPILLNQALQDKNEKKLIILHLHGSHAPYSNFTKEDKQSLVNLDNYDLTIHQTDRVIGNIFKTLNENKIKFSLIYTSDHGEVINKGHGFSRGRSQIEIPLLAYSNNGFDLCSDYKKCNNKNGDIGPLINKIVLLNMIGIKLEPSFIRNEINNENMIKANGDIINYRDFK